MPEGDTLYRTAEVLREILAQRAVVAAKGRPGGPQLERLVGARIEAVTARGKHLLIDASNGLTLHTHLRMHGSWHRYRPGEPWRRSPERAVAVIEVAGAVAVCFDAPTVELLETRALAIHPTLRSLGPDLLDPEPDLEEALRRLRTPERAGCAIGDALLDQRAQAGLGNVYRSEVCFVERVDPFAPVGSLLDETLERLLRAGQRMLGANRSAAPRRTVPNQFGMVSGAGGPRSPGSLLWVYGRAGWPCRRCGTRILSRSAGPLARRVYWCPACQSPGSALPFGGASTGRPISRSRRTP